MLLPSKASMNPAPLHFEKHIPVTDDQLTAVDILSDHTELPKNQIKQAMQKGAVWLTRQQHTQRLRRAKSRLRTGDQLHLYYDENILASEPAPAIMIADEGSYSIWYKPYGVYCQGSKWGDHCTINRIAEKQLQRPCFIVHRLDRATTGLVIVAHKKKTTAALATLFEQRRIEKHYQAIVEGKFPAAETINTPVDDKPAVSHISILSSNEQFSWVKIAIETGRKHQIRKHLSSIGFPIAGDRLYGNDQQHQQDLQLCCYQLKFQCPVSSEEKHYLLKDSLQLSLLD